ncbi:hypothetical protein GCM10023189_37380 [Nibrella saemangeumensis]|uniref:Uncharacterized protein n=1 Tax=Nibrella saemangeumensis TaxID=1084526 RepID=A0ABP8N9R6_9BACT
MATLSHSTSVYTSSEKASVSTLFNDFANKAEFNRIGWAATAIAVQGCVFSPALLLSMAYQGGGDWQFLVGILSFLMVLVPVLSALHVKHIFRAFTLSAIVHLAIILFNVFNSLA